MPTATAAQLAVGPAVRALQLNDLFGMVASSLPHEAIVRVAVSHIPVLAYAQGTAPCSACRDYAERCRVKYPSSAAHRCTV